MPKDIVEIPVPVLSSLETLDELHDWLTAQNPKIIEELREARRRQLEIEKKGVQSQLEILAASRAHLETAIASADAQSYQQSAGVGPNIAQAGPNSATPVTQGLHRTRTHRQRKRRSHRRLQT